MSSRNRIEGAISRRQLAGALFAVPCLGGATDAAAQPLEEVTRLMQSQKAAWNRGDIAGFCAPYAEDCIFISPSNVTRGRQTVQDRYAKKYGAAKETMGRLDFDVLETRPTAAMVTMVMRWSLVWSGARPPASGHTLIVWQLLPSGWRLVQDASM
jgi:uncharacterized protein (TIGR02246 family)